MLCGDARFGERILAVGHAGWKAVVDHAAVLPFAQNGEGDAASVGQRQRVVGTRAAITKLLSNALFKGHKGHTPVND